MRGKMDVLYKTRPIPDGFSFVRTFTKGKGDGMTIARAVADIKREFEQVFDQELLNELARAYPGISDDAKATAKEMIYFFVLKRFGLKDEHRNSAAAIRCFFDETGKRQATDLSKDYVRAIKERMKKLGSMRRPLNRS
jgi:hypothetical protein